MFDRRVPGRGSLRSSLRLSCEKLEPRYALTGVVINEFLALNDSGLVDQDGDRSDWIELHNTTASAVNLGGWRLTDDSGNLSKWTLPAVSLPAHGYLVVFASGKDRAIAGQQLHANFSLTGAGEYLALVNADGVVVDQFDPFPEQQPNVSYGRGVIISADEPLVDENAPVSVRVPTNMFQVSGLTWTQISYNDSNWTTGVSGVGFERSPGDTINFVPYIQFDVDTMMPNGRNTAYMRFEFDAVNIYELTNLTLKMRYDDGFIAYLNGQEIFRRNAPASPAWNSGATDQNGDSNAVLYQSFDVSAHLGALQEGSNVLAIHGLNQNDSSDFLIDPLLTASRAIPANIGYMANPTPAAANSTGTLGFVADTSFSVDRGFYDAPFHVQIVTATADATIRYTLDGSIPTATTGLIYNPASPPLITTTTVLRAAAFKTGFTPTNVDTQTYVFLDDVLGQNGTGLPPHANWGWQGPDWAMDPDVVNNPLYASGLKDDLLDIPSVSLVMPWNTWFGSGGQGIYISGSNQERQGSIEFFNAPGSDEFQIDGALEIQGGSSDQRWKTDKLSIRATFKNPFGSTKLEADIYNTSVAGDTADDRFDTLIFDAQLNYAWSYGGSSDAVTQRSTAKLIQDQYVADLQNLIGGQGPRGRFVHLYINGLYWGVYNMHERPDDSFAESYLGGDKDDYDVIKHNATTVVSGDATAAANYATMLNLVRQNMTVAANYAAATQKVDVDDLINYMIVNYYVGNDDWAHKNWYATYNRVAPDGKWRYHSWDAEKVMEGVSDNVIFTNGYTGSPEEVHSRLMANQEYRLRFSDLVQKHMENGGLLTPERAAAAYQTRMDEVYRAIVAESARWGDSHSTAAEPPGQGGAYTREHWLATQDGLLDNYFPARTAIVQGQFAARNWLVTLAAPQFSQYGGEVAAGYELSLAKPAGSPLAGVLYYTLDGSDPRLPGGGLSPNAIAVIGSSTNIVINGGTQVRARVRDTSQAGTSNDWSAEIDATFVLDTPFPLRITELHYNPAPYPGVSDPQDLEFIELLNISDETISLDGVSIADFASSPYVFDAGQTLASGQRIIVARNPTLLAQVYGGGFQLAPSGYGTANFSNGGETITLYGPQGEKLQQLVYEDSSPWPSTPDGTGPSMEVIDPSGDINNPANWRASSRVGGSPGTSGAFNLAGDYNHNGVVDSSDYTHWKATFGQTVLAGHGADGNGDGVITLADYTVWRDNLGAIAPAPLQAFAADAPSPLLAPSISQPDENNSAGEPEPTTVAGFLRSGLMSPSAATPTEAPRIPVEYHDPLPQSLELLLLDSSLPDEPHLVGVTASEWDGIDEFLLELDPTMSDLEVGLAWDEAFATLELL